MFCIIQPSNNSIALLFLTLILISSSMESHRNLTTNTIGFCLLPSELIHYIIIQLALPDIFRLKSVNKSISSIISDQAFIRDYNSRSSPSTWLFVYKKRWHRDSLLHGFTDYSDQWFNILISDMLNPVVPPGEDLYLLAAAGNIFLFALNNSREVISVNPMTRMVKRIPPSPLGPRGTSSWRRSGMKLLTCPFHTDNFRFLFAEMSSNNPVILEYDSRNDQWQSTFTQEENSNGEKINDQAIFVSAYNGRNGSIIIAKEPNGMTPPTTVRPRFISGLNQNAAFSWGNANDQMHVYGDGHVIIVKSNGIGNECKRGRMLNGVELWGLSSNGRHWEFISSVPCEIVDKFKKPYGAMMGCLEQRGGIVRAILMSNLEDVWDMTWISCQLITKTWTWHPIIDCKMKGANMAGIAFSSSLVLN